MFVDGATVVKARLVTTATNRPPLLRSDVDGIATLTLNRPRSRNALSRDLLDALLHELETLAVDEAVRVVILAAVGPAFCAGHDMKQIRANPGEAYYRVIGLPQPVIARVQGIATAAGCQLVASCDLAVAASSASFATPGVNIGLFCSTPLVALTRNVGRKRAMEMLLTGEAIDAAAALAFGLVNRVVDDDALEDAALALARRVAGHSPLTIAIGKRAFYAQIDRGLDDAYDLATDAMTRNMLARDAEEGIDAFLEKRPPQWEGR